MNLDDYIRQLEQAPQRAANRIQGRMTRAQRELLGIARRVVHVQSGNLRDRLAIEPPVVIDAGEAEYVVSSSASYAEHEAAKGGDHDFATLTIEEGADIIQSAANDVAEILASALVGQG